MKYKLKHNNYHCTNFGIYKQTELTITTDSDGLYNVLLIGTRKDETAMNNFKGVEVERKEETFKGVEPPNQNMHNK